MLVHILLLEITWFTDLHIQHLMVKPWNGKPRHIKPKREKRYFLWDMKVISSLNLFSNPMSTKNCEWETKDWPWKTRKEKTMEVKIKDKRLLNYEGITNENLWPITVRFQIFSLNHKLIESLATSSSNLLTCELWEVKRNDGWVKEPLD